MIHWQSLLGYGVGCAIAQALLTAFGVDGTGTALWWQMSVVIPMSIVFYIKRNDDIGQP